MHRLPKHEPIRVFEGFAGYGGATFGLRRAKINHKVILTNFGDKNREN